MKTLIKSLALALSLAVITPSITFAETNPGGTPKVVAAYKTGIYTSVTGKLTIALDKETGGRVDINLISADGRVLFSRQVGKNEQTFRARLNLSDLEDGVYQVEITNGVAVTTHKVIISTQQPTVSTRLISIN